MATPLRAHGSKKVVYLCFGFHGSTLRSRIDRAWLTGLLPKVFEPGRNQRGWFLSDRQFGSNRGDPGFGRVQLSSMGGPSPVESDSLMDSGLRWVFLLYKLSLTPKIPTDLASGTS